MLYIEAAHAIPRNGTIEVCFHRHCGVAPEMVRGKSGQVLASKLGDWTEHRGERVRVTVRDRDGEVVSSKSLVADKQDGCCGKYWTVRPGEDR